MLSVIQCTKQRLRFRLPVTKFSNSVRQFMGGKKTHDKIGNLSGGSFQIKVVFCAAAVIAAGILATSKDRDLTEDERNVLDVAYNKFMAYSDIALCSYDNNVRIGSTISSPPIEPNVKHPHQWKFQLDTRGSGAAALWKCIERPSIKTSSGVIDPQSNVTHVIAFRGTSTVQDWYSNTHLVCGTGELPNEYGKKVEEYENYALEMLTDRKHQVASPQVVFCGHSLGASLAESVHSLISKKPQYNIKTCGAVTFDSPGQPLSFRKDNDMLAGGTEGIITLNTLPNAINTLNAPCAKEFWACGRGASIPVEWFTLLRSNMRFWAGAITEHGLTNIKSDYLEKKDIHRADYRKWPVTTNWIISCFNPRNYVPWFLKPPSPAKSRTKPKVSITPPEPEFYLPSMPDRAIDLKEKSFYYMRNRDGFMKIFDSLDASDAVVILFGHTGAGKTTTMAALQDTDEAKLPIGGGTNNSVYPIITSVKPEASDNDSPKTLVIDLPGTGAANQATNTNEYKLTNDYADQLTSDLAIREYAGVFVLVVGRGSQIEDTDMNPIINLPSTDIPLIVALSVDPSSSSENDIHLKQKETAVKLFFKKINYTRPYTIVKYCAKKSTNVLKQMYDIKPLRDAIEEAARNPKNQTGQVSERSRSKREAEAFTKKDNEFRSASRKAATFCCIVAVGASSPLWLFAAPVGVPLSFLCFVNGGVFGTLTVLGTLDAFYGLPKVEKVSNITPPATENKKLSTYCVSPLIPLVRVILSVY